MKIVAAMDPFYLPKLFNEQDAKQMANLGLAPGDALAGFDSDRARDLLAGATVLLTFWEAPQVTSHVLDMAPQLAAVVHAAGSVKHHLTSEFFADPRSKNIAISSAVSQNALPVAEYALSVILQELKQVPAMRDHFYRDRKAGTLSELFPTCGNYDRTLGIIGASMTGRRLIELLAPIDIDILVYDPFLEAGEAARLGVEKVELDELAMRSDLVSIHAPEIPATHHMVDEKFLTAMRPGTVLLNTARGSLVDTEALLARLRTGDIRAILDVTDPDPLPADHELFQLENVVLTPHVAGSLGGELHRLGHHAMTEIARFAAGEPFATPVLPAAIASRA